MFVKVKDGHVEKFPYTVKQLKKDNPRTSFPKNIPISSLEDWGMFPVSTVTEDYDMTTHNIVWDSTPTLVDNKWVLGYTLVEKDASQLEKEAARADARKAGHLRKVRNAMLEKTDWEVVKGLETGTLTEEFKAWRQSLRDISADPEFPNIPLPVRPE